MPLINAIQHQVVVHVDASALSGNGGASDLPVESVRRLCCDGNLVALLEDGLGTPLSVGLKTGTVPTAMRRALTTRDRSCTYPGCTRNKWIDAHHIHRVSGRFHTELLSFRGKSWAILAKRTLAKKKHANSGSRTSGDEYWIPPHPTR